MKKRFGDLINKVEILFWTASVSVMRNQRIARLAIIGVLLLFFGLIMALVWLRGQNAHPVTALPDPTFPAALPPVDGQLVQNQPLVGLNQSNLLVILVDSFDAPEPELIGLWLVGRAYDSPQVVFLPMVPTSRPGEMELYQKIFKLDAYGSPASGFLDYLRTKKVWWDHYLVADKSSLADLVALVGGLDWDGRISTGVEVADSLPDYYLAPEAMLRAQARIASVLCQNSPVLIRNADPEIIWGLLTHRMRSDLDLEAVQDAQAQISKPGGSPVCEFPTLRKPAITQNAQ